jgi:hypothetical protein
MVVSAEKTKDIFSFTQSLCFLSQLIFVRVVDSTICCDYLSGLRIIFEIPEDTRQNKESTDKPNEQWIYEVLQLMLCC